MRTALLALTLSACAPSCASRQPPAPMPPPSPATLDSIALALDLSATIAATGAADTDDPATCAGLLVTSAVLSSAAEGVVSRSYPALSVDVRRCGVAPRGADIPSIVDAAILGSLRVAEHAIERARLPCEAEAYALGAAAYLGGASPAILSEFRAPDGVVDVSGIDVIADCDTDP